MCTFLTTSSSPSEQQKFTPTESRPNKFIELTEVIAMTTVRPRRGRLVMFLQLRSLRKKDLQDEFAAQTLPKGAACLRRDRNISTVKICKKTTGASSSQEISAL